ncbi:MAG: Ig-like domain-containing protein [Candidatus Levyibacteriota bacterium]
MKKTIWNKRIPTLLGILLIAIGIGLTSFLVQSGTNLIGKATPSETPENVRITNVSDNSFTVSYITSERVTGTISFGKENTLGENVGDDRDQKDGIPRKYKTHHVTVRNLSASTKYYFNIVSGENSFLNDNEPFNVTTGPTIDTPPSNQNPVVGKVTLLDGTSPSEAIAYLVPKNLGQSISTTVKSDGNYILPLNAIRNTDLNSYLTFSQDTSLEMLIIESEQKSTILLTPKQINPVPPITLSKNYDFTIDNSPVAQISESVGFPSFSAKPITKNPQILTPKKDETFTDQKPLFKGTSLPGSDIKITIHSDENLEVNIQADNKGNWSYRPENTLSAGEHTISITTRDVNGILKTISQSFVVYAQGSQVDKSATTSATPTQKITPIETPSVTPSSSLSPTPIPTSEPTTTSPPIIVPEKETISPPGNSTLETFILVFIGTILTGIILFIKTRRSASL